MEDKLPSATTTKTRPLPPAPLHQIQQFCKQRNGPPRWVVIYATRNEAEARKILEAFRYSIEVNNTDFGAPVNLVTVANVTHAHQG